MSGLLKIGVAACFSHPDPKRPVFKGKTLLYMERSVARWLMAGGVVPYLLPTPEHDIGAKDLVAGVNALVLQGGTDLSPTSYGEEPLKPEWSGDRVRDDYERALIAAAMARGIPVLGLCRGLQMINVALGGTLHQDIATQCAGALTHRDYEQYDRLGHEVSFEKDAWLRGVYPGCTGGRVNSVHHQAIQRLAPGLVVEARAGDGIIEAVRFEGGGSGDRGIEKTWLYGVQWHPEFQTEVDSAMLSAGALREMFLEAVKARRANR